MGEPAMKMPLSPSPSTSRVVQLDPSTPEIPTRCKPGLLERMQRDTCFLCNQQGHWARYCPLKSPNTKPLSPSPQQDSPVSPNIIRCRCGHGFCEVKIARNDRNLGRKYYACPIKRGARCKEFVKWCDHPVEESDLQPPSFKYPECECGAGVCRRVEYTEGTGVIKYYFTCPVKKDHGSCGYSVSEDELLNCESIVPVRRSRQRTLSDFWEGCLNDRTDNDMGKADGMPVQTKKMRIMNCFENHSLLAVSEIHEEEDASAAVKEAHSKHVGFPEFEVAHDDDLEFTNSVSWDTIEAEAFLLSRLIMFQRHIFADASFGSCPMGWLGRLLFSYPTQSLKFPAPKPFFCCIFPSFNPIVVPKQTSIPGGSHEHNQLAISSVSGHTQLSTGCHTKVSRDVISPKKSEDSERKSTSKAQRHREVVLFTLQRLLIDLETWDPCEHESMREAAESTFPLLNILGFDNKQFSDRVLDYINLVASIAEADRSMENSLTMEEHNKLFEEGQMRLAQLQDDYDKTNILLEASNQHRQCLCEEVSNLKAMLHEKQNKLKSCELETLKIETHLGDIKRSMLEADITLKKRAERTEIARKQNEERKAKQNAAKAALEKAKLEFEN